MTFALRAIMATTLSVAALTGAQAQQAGEIRVLLANHPYGDLLKGAVPAFEKETGIKVNVESLQESQLTTKLTTEFATKSSSVDVFMTRPTQDGKLFQKNGWYESLKGMDFADYPANAMSVVTYGGAPYIVPLVTEWHVLYYRKDLFEAAGVKVPTTVAELEAISAKLNNDNVAAIGIRGRGAAAVTQFSSFLYGHGGTFLDKGVAKIDTPEAVAAFRYYGKLVGSYGPKGVTSMSWENLLPLFQAGKLAMWADASVFLGQVIDPAKTSIGTDKIGIANIPGGPKASAPYYVTSWGIAVAQQSKRKEAARRFVEWASSAALAKQALVGNITVARSSVWNDPAVLAKVNPGLLETRAFAAKSGNPLDKPFMSAVGEARDRIGEVILESINTRGTSAKIEALAKDRNAKVNELLQDSGEYGK